MARLLHALLVAALVTGVLAPRLTAAAAELAPGTLRVVVICAGSGMATLVVDARGEAVELREAGPCTLAAPLPRAPAPPGFWRRLARALPRRPRVAVPARGPAPRHLRPPGRAPPRPA